MKSVNSNGGTLSQAFFDAWAAKQGKGGILTVQYKRRVWNESAQAFQYESSWTQYTMRQFVEVGNITFALDTPLLNEIKTSSLILKFKNSDYQLLPTNSTSGIFAPDAASQALQPSNPLRGYCPFLTQFQVLFGYKKADGTTESVQLFTGVAIDFNFQVKAGYVEVTVSGNEYFLQSSDAQLVSLPLPLIGGTVTSGVNDSIDFTINGSLSTLQAVVAPGVYTSFSALAAAVVSALNAADPSGNWSVVCPTTAPYVTVARGSGIMVLKWNTGMHAGASSAALLGFVTSADTPSAISASGTIAIPGQPTTGSYLTGVTSPAPNQTLPSPYSSTIINATGTGVMMPNLVVYDSGRTNRTTYPNGAVLQQGTDYSISSDSSYGVPVTITLTGAALGTITYSGREWYTLPDFQTLVILLAIQANIKSYNVSPVVFTGFGPSIVTPIGTFTGSAYSPVWTTTVNPDAAAFPIEPTVSAALGILTLDCPVFASVLVGVDATATTPSTPAYGIWTFQTSSLKSSVTQGSETPGIEGVSISFIQIGATGIGYFLNFHNPGSGGVILSLFRSDGSGSVGYAKLADFGVAPSTILGGSYDGNHTWTISRGLTGLIQVFCDGVLLGFATDNTHTTSDTFAVVAYTSDSSGTGACYISFCNISNNYSVVTTMADFSSLTCYAAIQALAKLADYEWGFDGSGSMYFRPKTPSNVNPVTQPAPLNLPIPFDQSDGISEVLEFRPGYADVLNDAQVTTPGFYREYNSSSAPPLSATSPNAPEAAPTSQEEFLTQILSEDYSDFQLAFDPIIAQSRAQEIHDENYLPRRVCRIKSKIMPFLDLSDVLNFSFYNRPLMVGNVFGDPLEPWGVSSFGIPQNVLARNMPGKLISMILDPNNFTGEYKIQEVL